MHFQTISIAIALLSRSVNAQGEEIIGQIAAGAAGQVATDIITNMPQAVEAGGQLLQTIQAADIPSGIERGLRSLKQSIDQLLNQQAEGASNLGLDQRFNQQTSDQQDLGIGQQSTRIASGPQNPGLVSTRQTNDQQNLGLGQLFNRIVSGPQNPGIVSNRPTNGPQNLGLGQLFNQLANAPQNIGLSQLFSQLTPRDRMDSNQVLPVMTVTRPTSTPCTTSTKKPIIPTVAPIAVTTSCTTTKVTTSKTCQSSEPTVMPTLIPTAVPTGYPTIPSSGSDTLLPALLSTKTIGAIPSVTATMDPKTVGVSGDVTLVPLSLGTIVTWVLLLI